MKSTHPHHPYREFIKWRRLHLTDTGLVLALALAVGILSGIGAWLLKFLIGTMTTLVGRGIDFIGTRWVIILVPVVGVTLTALFCRYILRADVDNGVARMLQDLKDKRLRLSGKTVYGSIIGSALTLGFGGTAGSEGPIAFAGAGIGSKLGQALKVSPRMLATLIGCGSAAGIAGIFKAPIGGALFAIEVLRVELSTVAIMGVFLATLAAALVAYVLSGCTLDIEVFSIGAFNNTTLVWAILLGVVCGLYSLYYTSTGDLATRLLKAQKHSWAKWIISGLMIGVMIYLFPSLYGEGYGTISSIINGHNELITRGDITGRLHDQQAVLLVSCVGILLLKGIGSSATNNGGGVAGDFAPTLFAGCILGLLYASAINSWGVTQLSAAHYALIAMAGTMAGIIRAPLMAIFLTTEMVGGVEFLLPSAIVALISYSIVMIIKRDTFYHSRPFTSPL